MMISLHTSSNLSYDTKNKNSHLHIIAVAIFVGVNITNFLFVIL